MTSRERVASSRGFGKSPSLFGELDRSGAPLLSPENQLRRNRLVHRHKPSKSQASQAFSLGRAISKQPVIIGGQRITYFRVAVQLHLQNSPLQLLFGLLFRMRLGSTIRLGRGFPDLVEYSQNPFVSPAGTYLRHLAKIADFASLGLSFRGGLDALRF
jgi:hypothetical protein